LEGKDSYESLWGELAENFGSAKKVLQIMELNDLKPRDHVAGREIIIPEGLELP
jgi:hypothetical protein